MLQQIRSVMKTLFGDRSGIAAVEFALIALPFFTMMFGTLEIGLLLLKTSIMEGATRDAARKVRTGAAQNSADPMGLFQQTLCTGLLGLYDCGTFYVDVRNFSDFTTITLPAVQFNANGVPTNLVFQPGGAGTVTTARVVHNHRFITPLIGRLMGSSGGNTLAVTSTAVFKTEPYQ